LAGLLGRADGPADVEAAADKPQSAVIERRRVGSQKPGIFGIIPVFLSSTFVFPGVP
jgi:hypothetical protein